MAPSKADAVLVFPLCRWCPPQETSQPHPPHVSLQNYYTNNKPSHTNFASNECSESIHFICVNFSDKCIIKHVPIKKTVKNIHIFSVDILLERRVTPMAVICHQVVVILLQLWADMIDKTLTFLFDTTFKSLRTYRALLQSHKCQSTILAVRQCGIPFLGFL